MFESCDLETAVLNNWDVHNAQFQRMFMWCDKLTSIDCTGWNTSGVTTFYEMFSRTYLLKNIYGLEDWDTSSATMMNHMFSYCGVNTSFGGEIDLSNWTMNSITKTNDV